jgi:hypothetical protein
MNAPPASTPPTALIQLLKMDRGFSDEGVVGGIGVDMMESVPKKIRLRPLAKRIGFRSGLKKPKGTQPLNLRT